MSGLSAFICVALLLADPLAELIAVAKSLGDAPAFVNEYVKVRYQTFEYPDAPRGSAAARPLVLYVRATPAPDVVNTDLLAPPRGARPSRPGWLARGIQVEILKLPPQPSALDSGSDLPRDTVEEASSDVARLVVATFRPLDYGVGTGRLPSVTTFLSEGAVEVASQGLRRRMLVQPGDAFWFEAHTRITVIDDFPVGAAILQISPR